MAAARAPLHLLPDVEPATTVVLTADLEAAIDNVAALADDLDAGLDAIAGRLFADSRSAALNEVGRLSLRVQRLRDDYAQLIDPTTPPAPRRLA